MIFKKILDSKKKPKRRKQAEYVKRPIDRSSPFKQTHFINENKDSQSDNSYKDIPPRQSYSHQESIDLRELILSLQFYLFAYIAILKNNDKTLSKDDKSYLDYLKGVYNIQNNELRLINDNIILGFNDYLSALQTDAITQKEFLSLGILKPKLKKFQILLKGQQAEQHIKKVFIYLIEFSENLFDNDSKKKSVAIRILNKSAMMLGLSDIIFDNLFNIRAKQQTVNKSKSHASNIYPKEYIDACRLLNIDEKYDFESVKQQYRRLMNKFHPDKLASSELSQQDIEKATELTQQYQKAYKTIKTFMTK